MSFGLFSLTAFLFLFAFICFVAFFYNYYVIINIKHMIRSYLTVCIPIMILGVSFSFAILVTMHTKNVLFLDAVLHLHIYLLGMPAPSLYNFYNAIFCDCLQAECCRYCNRQYYPTIHCSCADSSGNNQKH